MPDPRTRPHQSWIHRLLGRAPQPPARAESGLHTLAHRLLRIRTQQRLLRLMTRGLGRVLGATRVCLYLHDPDTRRYWPTSSHGGGEAGRAERLEETHPVFQALHKIRGPLYPLLSSRIRDMLDSLHAALIVPGFQGQTLLAVLVVGPRRSGAPYTDEEIMALTRLADDGVVALENARRYEELAFTARKLQSAQEQLLHQERLVAAGRLAMGLAHEIKNPLAAIKTFTEFLPERVHNPTFREQFVKIVTKEVERINRIVQSLSDFAKPLPLRIETLDVQGVLRELITLLSNECLKRQITVEQTYEPDAILLPADATQLKQAFLNLCLNALEAMERHGGTLSVQCRYQEGDAVIRIADTGIGIAKEHLAYLFDPFYTTKPGGMGLGLAVVKQVVEQHFGSITVESEPGRGSVFEMRLPLAVRFHPRTNESGVGASSDDRSRTENPPSDLLLPRPLQILVVDDEPKLREVLKTVLEGLGATVRLAETGEEALLQVGYQPLHLVILDLKLQAMDGFAVLTQLKRQAPSVGVLVLTGAFDEGIDREVRRLGALACLHKPLELPALKRQLVELARTLPIPRFS